jgi:hypothetical protein
MEVGAILRGIQRGRERDPRAYIFQKEVLNVKFI